MSLKSLYFIKFDHQIFNILIVFSFFEKMKILFEKKSNFENYEKMGDRIYGLTRETFFEMVHFATFRQIGTSAQKSSILGQNDPNFDHFWVNL